MHGRLDSIGKIVLQQYVILCDIMKRDNFLELSASQDVLLGAAKEV